MKRDLVRISVVGACAALDFLPFIPHLRGVPVFAIVATCIGAWPILASAWRGVQTRRMTMELSMAIALIAACSIGEWNTAAVITLSVLIAEAIEERTMERGDRAISSAIQCLPAYATVRRDGALVDIPPSDIVVGDIVVMKPGTRIPVDGVVLSGHTYVDQATITGESMPAEKQDGSSVFAGTLNQSGTIDIRTERVGKETTFGQILAQLERAKTQHAPIQKLADKLAGRLVLVAAAAALLTFMISRDLHAAIATILVAGACGVAAGTPLALLGAMGQAARLGIVIKGSIHLETISRIDTMMLDKTGTLTFGTPRVVALHPAIGMTREQLLAAIAAAEQTSEHPLARAITTFAKEQRVSAGEVQDFAYTPGAGIRCRVGNHAIIIGTAKFLEQHRITTVDATTAIAGATRIYAACDARFLGSVDIADTIRPESIHAIDVLKMRNITTHLLSGDLPAVATHVAQELHIPHAIGSLLPNDKADYVQRLRHDGHVVAAVGDGVNDAPALLAADIGIAMGSGTDVARDTADVVLIGNDLTKLVSLVELAKQCMRIIYFNFYGTLLVDVIGVLLAATGHLSPLSATFIHVGSELTLLFNAARLLPEIRTTPALPVGEDSSEDLAHAV